MRPFIKILWPLVTPYHSTSSSTVSLFSLLSSSSSYSDSSWRLRTTESSPRICESSLRRCVILGMPASWASSLCFSSFNDSRVPVSRVSKRQPPSPSNCSRCVWNFLCHKPSQNSMSFTDARQCTCLYHKEWARTCNQCNKKHQGIRIKWQGSWRMPLLGTYTCTCVHTQACIHIQTRRKQCHRRHPMGCWRQKQPSDTVNLVSAKVTLGLLYYGSSW